jgi:YD repeat-containing protein
MRTTTAAARLFLATSFCALATAATASETTTYTYDALGRLVATSSSGSVNNGLTTSIAYDPAGNRQSYAVSGASASPPPAAGCGTTVGIGGGSNTSATAQADGSYLVTKTDGGSGWNAEAVSSQGLSGPFALRFSIPAGNPSNVAAGVSRNPGASASYATIDYGFSMQPDGLFWVYASGNAVAGSFSASGNPVWVVRDAAGIITVRIGATAASATIVYTFAGAQTGTFYADSSFYAVGSQAVLQFSNTN